ncbi:hypothetical protein FSARC_8485 [Fusarium sarcochroum]|uniref:J domain-containing protein n=1 Tax=Fusarium sarcochroum TaxID=1208366 RepID=A0A8H4TSZ8_9HYPO|nr:hypothetical protein FSARC_8485 [Fusarium sarcochroum]
MLPLLAIVAMISGVGWLNWPTSPKLVAGPIGNINVQQGKSMITEQYFNPLTHQPDRICRVYHLIKEETPGLTAPPDLYEYLQVPRTNEDITVRVWQASACRADRYLSEAPTQQQEIFLRASTVLMDEATRSVYDGTFWRAIMQEEESKRGAKLKEICGWD